MNKPYATAQNWRSIGRKIHSWFMQKMGLTIGSMEERIFLGLALAGEAGELANKIKKAWRDGETPELEKEILAEIADVQGYLAHLAASYSYDLNHITADKTNELIDRWPQIWESPVSMVWTGTSCGHRILGAKTHCGLPQFQTPSGITCAEGHGGANPL